MPSHLVFFLGMLSFLSGVVFASLGLSLLLCAIPAAIVCAVLYVFNIEARIALFAAFLLLAGGLYYLHDDYRYHAALAAVPSTVALQGTIAGDPKRGLDYQSLYLKTDFGTMVVEVAPRPLYAYGETVTVEGAVETPSQNYSSRHIVGILRNPHIVRVSSGGGIPALAYLFGIKERIKTSYEHLLAPDQAALVYGIIFGVNENFSKQFSQNLEVSGLRFITAIDGLHMQIVTMILLGAFAYMLPRKYAFLITFVFVVLFIALTGFTVSGIRASLMAFLAGIAKETKRLYLPHTILTLAALVLALINPKVIVFDIGFQLSFLAVLSIVYFMPVLKSLLCVSNDPGVLGWKESLLITISVQLATAPIVIAQFQTFSLTSFIASVLVVWMLPFILSLGLFLALASLIWYPLAFAISVVLAPMIDYVAMVVNIFARLAVLFNPKLGFIGTVMYYGTLVSLMYWFYRKREKVPIGVPAMPTKIREISKEAAGFKIIECDE